MAASLDLLFLAKNRLEYTKESWRALMQNTDWPLVNASIAYDDGSTDGTHKALMGFDEVRRSNFGSPVAVFNDFITRSGAEYVAKVDNDTMLPRGWLGICLDIFAQHPELELLGLEAYEFECGMPLESETRSYRPTDHIGGIFVARRSAFERRPLPKPDGTFYGFTDWQKQNDLIRGWIDPYLPVFLLDRVPFDPWESLGAKYEALGWQRFWKRYNLSHSDLWKWAFPEHA